MKYNRLLFISIAVGILFSACATNQPNPKTEEKASVRAPSSKRIATATSGLTGPLPNYVKHNQWDFWWLWPTQRPYITVWLLPVNNQVCIQYAIWDDHGQEGALHWQGATNNESSTSSLFTTTFPSSANLDVRCTSDGEVIVQVTVGSKCYAWKSDSKYDSTANQSDTDVKWNLSTCGSGVPCQ